VLDEGETLGSDMALWCTIRTFAKHAAELGNQQPETPIFFVKPNNCLQRTGPISVSSHPGEVHHEIECVVRLNEHAQPEAVAVGLDLTDRLTQGELRTEQLPWTKGKCFRGSAYVGGFVEWKRSFESLNDEKQSLCLNLWVNDVLVQSASLSEMTLSPAVQVEELLTWAPVSAGDYLFTGTPAGVGQLHPNDRVYATLESQDGTILSFIETQCQ
jgi:2-keto-4-pentenoate hydratase/2-oxohepta-3-ene-1,7-dioic acid hydratase in catechol pathway|tara:strand:+ start:1459 stop:2100 length:642 start_codon:yes stop_codon:yes gene_type:complete